MISDDPAELRPDVQNASRRSRVRGAVIADGPWPSEFDGLAGAPIRDPPSDGSATRGRCCRRRVRASGRGWSAPPRRPRPTPNGAALLRSGPRRRSQSWSPCATSPYPGWNRPVPRPASWRLRPRRCARAPKLPRLSQACPGPGSLRLGCRARCSRVGPSRFARRAPRGSAGPLLRVATPSAPRRQCGAY